MDEFGDHSIKSSSAFLMLIFVVGLIVGGMIGCYITFQQVNSLKNDVSNLKAQVSNLWGSQTINIYNVTVSQNSTALSEIYDDVNNSVVLIRGITSQGGVQASGFVYNFSGTMVVITNYHVVHGTTNMSVTFSNGNGYAATVNGTDPYADLAVLLVDAPQSEFKPLEIASSSALRVGEPVIALGNPYGLVGSITTGVVSALGRTITEEEYTGGFGIANIIQTSAPINPGNSGGPLLNYCGKVVGITTAIIADSQGLGFAVPSNTLLREIWSLFHEGSYEHHSWLGVKGTDMTYETAQELQVNVTYGWLIAEVTSSGPSDGRLKTNDVIIAMNETQIRNGDDLASYLEENTLPGYTVTLTIKRKIGSSWDETKIPITLGTRPPPSV